MIMKKKIFQQGVTVVEISIAVVVLALLTFYSLLSFYKITQQQQNDDAKQTIEIIKKAVIGYATHKKTPSYTLVNGRANNKIDWQTSASRPYLPCPDITGDGLEDRRPLLTAVTLVVNSLTESYPLEQGGDCFVSKGLLPWRTLGTPKSDPWGNYYTYRVDYNFSNEALGFDESMQSNDVYYTRPMNLYEENNKTFALREIKSVNQNLRSSDTGAGVVANIWGNNLDSENSTNIICEQTPCSRDTVAVSLIVGNVLADSQTVRVGELPSGTPVFARMQANNIDIGVPFVILSHGRNGHGAVNSSGISSDGAASMLCRQVPLENEDERQNAFWLNPINTIVDINGITVGFNCPVVAPSDATAKANGFVTRPFTDRSPGIEEFDDIVGWMSTEELMRAMYQNNVLTEDFLPPLGLEDI